MSRKGHKLTVERLKSRIVEVQYEDREVLGQRMVTANFKMDNGFIVYGKNPSTAIDPANFDADLAQEVAYNKTLDQLWELETYRTLSESMLFDTACGVQLDVWKYKVKTSESFSSAQHQTSCVNVMFQAPSIRGYIAPPPFTITLLQANQFISFERENAAAVESARAYILKHIPAEDLHHMLIVRIAKTAYTAQYVYAVSELDGGVKPWGGLGNEDRRKICDHVVDILRGVEGRFPTTLSSKIFISVVNSFK